MLDVTVARSFVSWSGLTSGNDDTRTNRSSREQGSNLGLGQADFEARSALVESLIAFRSALDFFSRTLSVCRLRSLLGFGETGSGFRPGEGSGIKAGDRTEGDFTLGECRDLASLRDDELRLELRCECSFCTFLASVKCREEIVCPFRSSGILSHVGEADDTMQMREEQAIEISNAMTGKQVIGETERKLTLRLHRSQLRFTSKIPASLSVGWCSKIA
jgi:hypothetical protein